MIRENEKSTSTSSLSIVRRVVASSSSGLLLFPKLASDLISLSLRITISMMVAAFRLFVPPAMKNLIGETVLITGAGHGIGRELAVQLAALGCTVVCWDTDERANRSTIAAILEQGGEAHGYLVDVSKRLEVRETALLMKTNEIPDVSILINNAAILVQRPLLEHSHDEIEETFAVNVLSNFWTIEAFLPTMLRNGAGHVVAVCSMAGIHGVSNKVPYCSSKYAVRGLMDGIREEFRNRTTKINFTTVFPFYVDTGFAEDPKYRFPCLFRAVTARHAASEVIGAFGRNYTEYAIPRCLFPLSSILRLLPEPAMNRILDFLSGYPQQRE